MPLTSGSANLNPGDFSVRSTNEIISASSNFLLIFWHKEITSSSVPIGTIATYLGAIFGGNTSPFSSL